VASLKQAVSLPVFAGNRIPNIDLAESILSENKADVIGWIRPLICDSHLPRKLAEGRPEEIVTCVYDNQACIGWTNRNKSVGCIQNPWAGNEGRGPKPGKAAAKARKRVVVVGAGPAGLKAACIAASEGHDVTVYERAEGPGGQLRLARLAPGRAEIGGVIDNLLRQANRLGVSIATGREMTAESIVAENPDAVILATGSYPHPHPVPGEYGPPEVLNVLQVLQNVHPIGTNVLMIDEDGHHKALATAEFLADQGKRVDILTSELFVGLELASIGDLYTVRQRLLQKGAKFICDRVVLKIEGRTVSTADRFTEDLVVYDSYDTIVLAMGNMSDDRLYRELKGRLPAVYRAGDCVAPRKIDSAIFEANQVALRIEL
jgi:NADPH-dependent 2,4-dienoyl-CoA reductase/sulfur reductase-like enzyme